MTAIQTDPTGQQVGATKITDPVDATKQAAVDAQGAQRVSPGTAALKSLDAVTVTSVGVAYELGSARSNWAVQVSYTGSPTNVVVDLEVCLNMVKWVKVGSWDNGVVAANGDTIWFTGKPATQVRLRLTTLVGGTNPTVNGWLAGY